MSTTTTVGPDVATRHVLVTTEAFTGQLRGGFPVNVPKGTVLAVDMLGQTNVYAGMGPRHPSGVLIEHETAQPGDVLRDDEVAPAAAAAKEKQDAVPAQMAARQAHAQSARAAAAKVIPDMQAKIDAMAAEIEAMKAAKPT